MTHPRPGAALPAALLALALLLAPATGQEADGPRRVGLDEAVDVALANSPALTRSRSAVNRARYDRTDAFGNFLPDLSLGYSFSDASTGRLDPTGQSIVTTSWTMQLTGQLDLFDGLRRFSTLETTGRELGAERARHRRTRYETILSVTRAFYDAVARREVVRVEQDRVERQQDQLEFVEQQVEVGQATRSDLLRSRRDLNNAKLQVLNAENRARAATFELARAMGVRERVAPVEEATLSVEPLDIRRDELMRRALAQGPDVQSARAAVEAAEARISTARSAYLPSLALQGGWAWQDAEFPPRDRSWQLRLQGSLPLFNGFQRENDVYRARARANAARAEERAAELQLRADVDDAFSQVESAMAGVDLAEQSVELSREDLRVTRERYRLGLATILDLQTAQIALAEAEVELVQRRFDYRVGLARLESLVGAELAD